MGLGFGTPDVARFLAEVERDGRLLAEFHPDGRTNGPDIKVYRIDEGAR